MKPKSLEFLGRLLNTPSPSSGEAAGQRVWLDYVTPYADEVGTDAYGNAWAILNPKGTPRIMVGGHADEIAFQIQYISEEGFLYFAPVGGPDPALARGQRVEIHHEGKRVLGVIGSLAIHMQDRSKKAEAPEWHDLFIDIGAADKKDAEKRVSVGDLITYTVGFEQLNGEVYVARGCDNRVGTFVAAETLRLCAERKGKLDACLIAVSTVQEENGLYGASMVGYSINPDAALVVDVCQATDIPITSKKRFGDIRLGKGPALNRGSVNHPVLVDRLAQVAKKRKLKHQWGIDSRWSGTDADAIFKQRGGIPVAALGIPNRYMHSPIEAIHLGDLETLAELLHQFVADVSSKDRFKVKI
ncbi:MAG: M20/M25/M40 family metallo-hydrolase [Verrucomicrobium sp.]|nr:M20/M25/M40 family metallo-hydrolase [Verrucomicrobium sp.]